MVSVRKSNPPPRSDFERALDKRVKDANEIIAEAIKANPAAQRTVDEELIKSSVRFYLEYGRRGVGRTRAPSGNHPGYTYQQPHHGLWTLAKQRAAQELESALGALKEAVNSKDLPVHPWDLRALREGRFSIATTTTYVDFDQWIAHWIDLAHIAATEPVKKSPPRESFEPAKRVAAEIAAELLLNHGLPVKTSRSPNNLFTRLTATIHGEHIASHKFYHHCLEVENALKARGLIPVRHIEGPRDAS